MEEQKKENTKGKKTFWLITGIVLFASYFSLLGIMIYLQWGQEQRHYLDGFNGTFEGLARAIYSFFVLLGSVPIFILTLLYACFLKSMFGLRSRIHNTKRTFLVLLILLNPILLFSVFNSPRHEQFTKGYRDWAKSVLDIKEIRDWMSGYNERYTRIGSKDFQGPKCLAEYYSRLNTGLVFNEEGEKILRTMSGGGFQSWGIVIGSAKMEVPDSENYVYSGGASEYRLKLADGAYVWYELQ